MKFTLLSAAVVAFVAMRIRTLLSAMPPPYDNLTALDWETSAVELVPGRAAGSKFPASFEGPLALNTQLRSAIKIFAGKILGAESVAVTSDGDLVLLDRYGFVFRANKEKKYIRGHLKAVSRAAGGAARWR